MTDRFFQTDDTAVFRCLGTEGAPGVIGDCRTEFCIGEFSSPGDVCGDPAAFKFRHGFAGDLDFNEPGFSGNNGNSRFETAVPFIVRFAGKIPDFQAKTKKARFRAPLSAQKYP
jgi:hypothetical protein